MAKALENQQLPDDLPVEGSDAFDWKESELLEKITSKYAWSAQHNGVINQNEPITTPPMRDYAFNRIMKSHYSFPYVPKRAFGGSGLCESMTSYRSVKLRPWAKT